MFKKKNDLNIDLGLRDDTLSMDKIELDFDLFKSKKKKKKFPEPKPRYSKETKPILTKAQQTEAKKFLKETGSAFGGLVSAIKNRKIRKLEKQAQKAQEKSNALAHKIKTVTALNDSLTDIERYEEELKKVETELRERKAQRKDPENKKVEHSNACIEYNKAQINSKFCRCICEDQK